MSMSKKDFIRLADYIKDVKGTDREFSTGQLLVLWNFCASVNPNFKGDRWTDYINGKCGKNGGAIK